MAAMERGVLPDSAARSRSRAAVAAAGVVLLFALVDVLRDAPRLPTVLGARALWIAALLGTALLLRRDRGRRTVALLTAVSGLSVAALFVLSLANGGMAGGAFIFLVTLPLFLLVFVPDYPGVLAFSGAASTVCSIAVAIAGDAPPGEAALLGMRAAVATALAVLGSTLHAELRKSERRLADERARADEAREAAERAQADAERDAVAGRAARGAAHDMANPLASIQANLEWLRDALADPRSDAAEVREVVGETRECVDRLANALRQLRAAGQAALRSPAAAPPGEGGGAPGGGRPAGGTTARE